MATQRGAAGPGRTPAPAAPRLGAAPDLRCVLSPLGAWARVGLVGANPSSYWRQGNHTGPEPGALTDSPTKNSALGWNIPDNQPGGSTNRGQASGHGEQRVQPAQPPLACQAPLSCSPENTCPGRVLGCAGRSGVLSVQAAKLVRANSTLPTPQATRALTAARGPGAPSGTEEDAEAPGLLSSAEWGSPEGGVIL